MSSDDFFAPVCHGITQPMLFGGVPREFGILNLTLTMNLVLGLKTFLGVGIGVLVHVIAMFLAKKDPYFLEVFRRHLRQNKKHYHV